MTASQSTHSTVIITGASSGVGLYAALALAKRDWFVVMACRDVPKAEQAARALGIPKDRYAVMAIDLGSQQSVRDFVSAFRSIFVMPAVLLNSSNQATTRSSNLQPGFLPKHWYGAEGGRSADFVADGAFSQCGVHWSWGNRQKAGRQAFSQALAAKASNEARASRLWDLSERMVGLG